MEIAEIPDLVKVEDAALDLKALTDPMVRRGNWESWEETASCRERAEGMESAVTTCLGNHWAMVEETEKSEKAGEEEDR